MENTTIRDDWALLREFRQSGAPECLGILFDRYSERLYARAYAICHDSSLAEDCVQETFRRVIEKVDKIQEISKADLWGWLATIIRRVFLDEIRRTQREQAAISSRRRPDRCPPIQESRALLAELNSELARLAPEYSLCYILFQLEGCSYKEIAVLTGYTYAQVKTRIQTARRQISRRFRPAEGQCRAHCRSPRAALNGI